MSDPDPDQTLKDKVKAAIVRTTAALRAQHPDHEIAGYALCTDDGLETLLYLGVAEQVLQSGADPDLLFTPTDWPYEAEAAAFDEADRLLRERAAVASDLRRHVDNSFQTLVDALSEARADGVFGEDVFLSVLSTDPSDYLEELEATSIQRLNADRLVQARKRFIEKWS